VPEVVACRGCVRLHSEPVASHVKTHMYSRKQTLEDGYQRGDSEKLYNIHYTPLLQLLWRDFR
jgi:hypothetical protein